MNPENSASTAGYPAVTNAGVASYDQIWQGMTTRYIEEQALIRSGDACCHSCTHYQWKDDEGTTGWCHRHAPSPARYPEGVEIEEVHTVWPTVTHIDFCGEFKLK